jgi:chitodextrinase
MKKIFLTILIAALISTTWAPYVYALENIFQVNLTVAANDTTPPSIPTNLLATAISPSQIDLSWDASTDNLGVAGYRIFRDSIILATTTNTTYSDAGLIESTFYEYTVEAFDAAFLYSGQSATSSTTTLAVPVTPPPTPTPSRGNGGGSTGYSDLLIINPKVSLEGNGALIDFQTNQPAQAKIYWGKTQEYELGTVSGLFYNTDHSVKIEGLEPNTHYFFRIEAVNGRGVTAIVDSSFQSSNDFINLQPINITQFKAIPQENSIALTWKNPSNEDFDSVRIVRSDKFFPRDIFDGQLIFEGNIENYVDNNVQKGVQYYYSIFAKNSKGEYSSGALAQAKILLPGEIRISPTSTDPFITIPDALTVDPIIEGLSLADFDFIQDGRKIVNLGNSLTIDGSRNLTISLEYGKVPEILKTIAITLADPDDPSQVFPFLLRVNKDKTAYEATIAPLGKSGRYAVSIIILDYKNQGLKRLNGSLQALVFETDVVSKIKGIHIALAFLILLIAAFIALWRIRNKTKVIVN